MTKALEEAFNEAAKLPEPQQDALAEAIRTEIRTEEEWERSFSGSQDVLERLADDALSEHRAGRTKSLHRDRR